MDNHREFGRAVPVQITVLSGNNLRGSRTDLCLSFVRVEFNGSVLGDSQKLDIVVDKDVVYNFTCSFECSEVAHTLDDVAHKPVILTVLETLPKEKKQKEEKTTVLGQAVVDLLPLLRGQCSFSSTVLLHDVAVREDGVRSTLDVTVSVPEPLLSDGQRSDSNVLMVTVETMYSVPEVWNPASTPPSSYVAALQIPDSAMKEQVLLFSNGILKMGGEQEPVPRPKKWPLGPLVTPGAEVIQGLYIDSEPTDTDHGDLTDIEDKDFRENAECNENRVSWDTARRCFIDAGGVACLSRRIAECRLWPVEIMKANQTVPTKGGRTARDKQGEEEAQISFHGVVYMDLVPLLYPGVRRIHGVYRVYPFYESDLLNKTQRTYSVLKELSRAPPAPGRTRDNSSVDSLRAFQSKTLDNQRGNKEVPKKPDSQGKSAQSESVTGLEPPVNTEGQMYADSRSYIIIEIAMEKPLVPKRPPEELAKRVEELVPPRPPLPRRPAGAERAVQEYQSQIASVAAQVLDQYQQLFGTAFVPGGKPLDPVLQEQRKTQLLGELNCSGKYFAFKEQMKYSVVRIVREKMLRTEAFSDPEQLQAFLSQLYVFLVDEMHAALNKSLSVDSQDTHHEPLLSCAQLKHFAREAQLNTDYQLAEQYYQECLIRDRSDPSHWFDYGAFHMLTADHLKAEECFQQALSIEQTHIPSLLMCGVLSDMNGRYEDAETFFERATSVEPNNVVAWTLFGVFCQAQEKFIQAEMTFREANKHFISVMKNDRTSRAKITSETQSGQEEEQKDETSETGGAGAVHEEDIPQNCQERKQEVQQQTTIFMETVWFLLQNYALQMSQRTLALELLSPDRGTVSSYHLALARLHLLRGEHDSAEASLKEALIDNFQNPDTWALWGHLHHARADYAQAQSCYERTLDSVLDASDTHSVHLRLGSIYLQEGEYEKAKAVFLRVCKRSPSCLTWLRLGIACYRLEELSEAEEALTEANALNNRNPEVWAYLCLVCLQTGRKLEAEQSYKYAMKMNLQKESLLQEIHDLQSRVGFGNPSF
ncbi:cilia- and flagella-associated protein 70 [Rhinichthys klamathensis goyatoka]|uniref:cilia- and flagella-associated protein 70 n=1 Tax=Rhinichthys klamathensis goyatoka TaxID=3034132 RepID=UPI0024B598D1|nr:cilia- and flagella-associated protein 70 [Rhinichthys klamathensis goyatoka]